MADYGLEPVGSFFLAIMHDPDIDPVPQLERGLDASEAAGGSSSSQRDREGYDDRPILDETGRETLFSIWTASQHNAVSAASTPLSTRIGAPWFRTPTRSSRFSTARRCGSAPGRLACGGAGVAALTERYADRVSIVHAKDVHTEMSDKLLTGELVWADGIRAGIFDPIGEGDIDFAAIVATLIRAGFDGCCVLEQDVMLGGEPAEGEGPIANARTSLNALKARA